MEVDGISEKTKDEPVYKSIENYTEYQLVIMDLKNSLPSDVDNVISKLDEKTRNYINTAIPKSLQDFETHYNTKTDIFEKLSILAGLL